MTYSTDLSKRTYGHQITKPLCLDDDYYDDDDSGCEEAGQSLHSLRAIFNFQIRSNVNANATFVAYKTNQSKCQLHFA